LANERADAIRMARDLCGGGAFLDSLHLADVIEKHVFRAGQAESVTTPIPPRRLREYKGVTYRDGRWHMEGTPFDNAFTLMYWYAEFVDADHAALLALRDDPWEPEPPTIADVVKQWLKDCGAKVYHDDVDALCFRIRTHLATQPQPITPEQAVAVLVEGGAKLEQVTYRATVGTTHMTAGTRILILPTATPETTP
jgi:hypothetical protein